MRTRNIFFGGSKQLRAGMARRNKVSAATRAVMFATEDFDYCVGRLNEVCVQLEQIYFLRELCDLTAVEPARTAKLIVYNEIINDYLVAIDCMRVGVALRRIINERDLTSEQASLLRKSIEQEREGLWDFGYTKYNVGGLAN